MSSYGTVGHWSFLMLLITGLLGVFLTLLQFYSCSGLVVLLSAPCFNVDLVSVFMLILVSFLGVYTYVLLCDCLSKVACIMLLLSLLFTSASVVVNHSIIFWMLYELSMLPLLYLIFSESPYSERFAAGWYFAGYLIVTSLPLVLVIWYLSYVNDSFTLGLWEVEVSHDLVLVILAILFFTKVPLLPFHTWLPVVHAEASSIVSVCLSGYVMKLGLLGFCRLVFPVYSSSYMPYLCIVCFASVGFLFVASRELDGKRWLALLSLSHIVVSFIAFFVAVWDNFGLSFFYSVGHGISAGLVFCLLWCFYESCATRNWLLVKYSLSGRLSRGLLVFSLLTLCSFPPSIQFFSEVWLLCSSLSVGALCCYWFLYLFVGGLVPVFLMAALLFRSECSMSVGNGSVKFNLCFIFLLFWCFCGVGLI